MRPRIRKLLQPVAFLAPPATALLGLAIGMSLGAVLIVPAKKVNVAPPAKSQQAQANRSVAATQPRSDFERRVVTRDGI
jgi:xanthosine utilization system XapX-like protein